MDRLKNLASSIGTVSDGTQDELVKEKAMASSLVNHQGGDVEGVDVQELRVLVRQVVEDLLADPLHIRLACNQSIRMSLAMAFDPSHILRHYEQKKKLKGRRRTRGRRKWRGELHEHAGRGTVAAYRELCSRRG